MGPCRLLKTIFAQFLGKYRVVSALFGKIERLTFTGTFDAFQHLVKSHSFKQICFPHRSEMGVLKSFPSSRFTTRHGAGGPQGPSCRRARHDGLRSGRPHSRRYGGTCRALALHLGLHRNAARRHLTSGSRGQGISKIVSTSCTASVADQAFSGFLIERPPASRQREWNPSSSTSSRPSANSRAASSTAGRSQARNTS